MTYRQDFTLPAELMEQVAEQGLEILPELIRIVVNAAMQAERSEYLQAEHYQHTDERRGYANGYKPKTLHTRVGDITFAVPQVREGGFYPQALEKGLLVNVTADSVVRLLPPLVFTEAEAQQLVDMLCPLVIEFLARE